MLLSTAIITFLLVFSIGSNTSQVVQSQIVKFPKNGKVIVQAREEVGKNPRMLLISQANGKVLFDYVYDESKRRFAVVSKQRAISFYYDRRYLDIVGIFPPALSHIFWIREVP